MSNTQERKAAPSQTATTNQATTTSLDLDQGLDTLLSDQAARLRLKRRRDGFILLGLAGCGMAAAAVWYVSSPTAQRDVHEFVANLKSSGKDLKVATDPAAIAAQYQKGLDKIAAHSNQVNDTSTTLGIDASKVKEDGFVEESRGLIGNGVRTAGERDRLLKERMSELARSKGLVPPTTGSTAPAPAAPVAAPAARPAAPAAPRPPTRPAATGGANDPLIIE